MASAPTAPTTTHRQQLVVLETTRHRIHGAVTLTRDGYRSRVSDVLNASDRDFVSLTDATVKPLDGDGPVSEHPFLAVSRAHIVLAVPVEEEGREGL
jgi:hypothetical protein